VEISFFPRDSEMGTKINILNAKILFLVCKIADKNVVSDNPK
jgi:hypothetical protein